MRHRFRVLMFRVRYRTLEHNVCVKLASIRLRLSVILLASQTATTRLWFGATSFFFGLFLLSVPTANSGPEYALMLALAPYWVWAAGFCTHGVALIYGAYTNCYSKWQLYLEGVLGVIMWSSSAYTVTMLYGRPNAHLIGAALAFWVYIRYPTHWEDRNGLE